MKKVLTILVLVAVFMVASIKADMPDGIRILGQQTMDVNGNYGSEVAATDPDGDDVTIEPVAMPEGMMWDAATSWWHWTPSGNQIGIHYLVVRATDPDGAEDVGCFVLEVVQRNRPPVLTESFIAQITEWMNIVW